MKNKSLIKNILISLIALFLGLISCFFLKSKEGLYLLFALFLLYGVLFIFYRNKFDLEKSIIMLFILFIPFMTELKINNNIDDFHIVAKMSYGFNYIHLFCLYFLIKIFKNINKCKLNSDLIILFILHLVCIVSIIRSINPLAGFYDYIRYLVITIIYIYFSRIFDYKKYKDMIAFCLVTGMGIQLILGILQIIKGSGLGLRILGESGDVFRLGVTGYERGFSGTFGHPGPIALYANIILIMFLFDKETKKTYRNWALIISTIIIIMAAGRTSILIMLLVYGFYFAFESRLLKKIILIFVLLISTVIALSVFSNEFNIILARFTDSDMNQQYDNRLEHVLVGIEYIKQKPLLGLGLNNYLDNTYRDYPASFYDNFLLWNPIHNAAIQYAVEIGIIGVSTFYYFLLSNLVLYFKIKNKIKISEKNVLKGSVLVIVIWIIYGFQGWGGIQTRSLLMLFLNCSLISNKYYKLKNI